MSNDFSYDAVPYQSNFQPQMHPDRMATLAALLGMKPAAVENCRYLEIGCGEGDNLIGFAYSLPESEFVGIDLSARQIETANRSVAELGLKNIRFVHLDVMQLDPEEYGQFDFIAAHGFFSWVPDAARRKVLELYDELLAPDAVGYLSYNVLPGGYLRQMMRDMMLYHTQAEPPSLAKVENGLSFLGFLRDGTPKNNYYQTILKNETNFVLNHDATSVLHDELNEDNQPFYFHEFAKLAAENGLQYLCETEYYQTPMGEYPPPIRETLESFGDDLVRLEQYTDFLLCRRFRQTLLCRADVKLNRNVEPDKLREFYIASAVRPADKTAELVTNKIEKFRLPNGAVIELDHPLTKVALAHLGSIRASSINFNDLANSARRTIESRGIVIEDWEKTLQTACSILLELYKHSAVELHVYQPRFAGEAGEFPRVSPLAQWQLKRVDKVTTLNNSQVKIEDSFFRHLLPLLDGTRNKLDLKKELRKKISAGQFSDVGEKSALLRDLPTMLQENLAQIAKLGLLIS